MKLFISYSRDDKQYVYELADRLRDDGNHAVWIDKAALVGGDSWWETILKGIEDCECVIVILTPRALGSIYCDAELRYAQALNKPILPLMLKPVEIPDHLSTIQAENVSDISLERTYGKSERALGQIELRRERGHYPAPQTRPTRPTVPVLRAGQESEHVFEVYANAVEALEKDVALAKKLLQQVIIADPSGLGIQAAERLAEIDYEQDRQKAYLAIARLAGNPGLRRDAIRAWKAFTAKYGTNHDPNDYAQLLADQPVVPVIVKPRYTLDQERLLSIMLDPKRPPAERAEAGREINKYGDPRPGILDFNFQIGEYWCPVPAGTYLLGSDEDSDNPKHQAKLGAFYMARYPVTYKQYQAFVEDKNGFANIKWWQGLHADGLKQQAEGVGDQRFKFDNHPCECVSWYDAMAFCRWLSAKLGYEVRLPREDEWEAAARGTDERRYPWGNDYKSGFANINETYKGYEVGAYYLETTTAVGIYPQGASPWQVLDMSGNVWEWTLDEYQERKSNKLTNNESRALRGGSWDYLSVFARAAYRYLDSPADRNFGLGFRVVCSAPVP